jgi:transcriptional regulator with XRE-family HTH domain
MTEQEQDRRSFGQVLKSYRKSKKLSARILKLKSESRGRKIHLGAIETDRSAPPVANDIIAMAKALELTQSDTQKLLCKAIEKQKILKVAVPAETEKYKTDLLINFIQKWDKLTNSQAKELEELISKY